MRVPVRAFVTCACVLTGVKPRRRVTATTAENHTRSGPRSATPCAGIRLFFFLPFRFVFFTPLIPVVICVFVVCHPDSYYYNIYSPIISPLPTSPPRHRLYCISPIRRALYCITVGAFPVLEVRSLTHKGTDYFLRYE